MTTTPDGIIGHASPDSRSIRLESFKVHEGPTNFTQHELSRAFPAMSAEEFDGLKESIRKNGIQQPIVLLGNEVIDGWHRYTAGKACFMRIPTVELGDVDPVAYVVAANAKRRNLSSSQLAFAVTEANKWTPSGRPSTHVDEKWTPGVHLNKTNAELAALAEVSVSTIKQAKSVQTHASPEVQAAVKAGTMSAKAAAATVKPQKTVTPKPAPAPVVEEEPAFDPADYELSELRETVRVLADENNSLKDQLAAGQMAGTDDEKKAVLEIIAELRKTVSNLEIEVDAIRNSRDKYQRDNADMKTQLSMQRRQLAKLQQVPA